MELATKSKILALFAFAALALAAAPVLALDSDLDGITDEDETYVWGTDPFLADTDSDGLSDWDEIFAWHSNPLLPDTNNDGTSDGAAVAMGWDPNHVNVDGDGFLNGADSQPEIFNGNGGRAPITWSCSQSMLNPPNGVSTILDVNPATGELFTTIPLVNLPVAGSSLSLNLYNRTGWDFDGPLGRNNTSECFARIIGSPTSNITLQDGRGHVGSFINTGGGTFTTPAGWYCTVSYTSPQYTVEWPHGEKSYFDSTGKLLAALNKNQVGYTCSYDLNNNLVNIMTTTYSAHQNGPTPAQ